MEASGGTAERPVELASLDACPAGGGTAGDQLASLDASLASGGMLHGDL